MFDVLRRRMPLANASLIVIDRSYGPRLRGDDGYSFTAPVSDDT